MAPVGPSTIRGLPGLFPVFRGFRGNNRKRVRTGSERTPNQLRTETGAGFFFWRSLNLASASWESSQTVSVISTTSPYSGKIVSLRVDDVRLDDGHVMRQEVVEHRPSMTVIAIDARDADDRIILVRQYRHPTGEVLLETPAGSVDEGETAEDAVNRELAEETGLRARGVISLGAFYLAPGWATEYMHAYLAQDLYEAAAAPDEDERIEVVRLPLGQWQALIDAGEIRDCKSIAAWHLALPHLGLR